MFLFRNLLHIEEQKVQDKQKDKDTMFKDTAAQASSSKVYPIKMPAEDNLCERFRKLNLETDKTQNPEAKPLPRFKYIEYKKPKKNDYYQIADCPWSTKAFDPREEKLALT